MRLIEIDTRNCSVNTILLLESHVYSVSHRCVRGNLGLITYPTKSKVTEYTSSFASHYTPVLDLRVSCVAVHLCELDLGLRADTLWEGCVANEVPKSLPKSQNIIRRVLLCKSATKWLTLWCIGGKSVYLSGSFSAKTFRFV